MSVEIPFGSKLGIMNVAAGWLQDFVPHKARQTCLAVSSSVVEATC